MVALFERALSGRVERADGFDLDIEELHPHRVFPVRRPQVDERSAAYGLTLGGDLVFETVAEGFQVVDQLVGLDRLPAAQGAGDRTEGVRGPGALHERLHVGGNHHRFPGVGE